MSDTAQKSSVKSSSQNQATFEKDPNFKPYFQKNAEDLLLATKNETAPFLGKPNETGVITITPQTVVSAETGRIFKGSNQLLAQIKLKELSSNESELITFKQANSHSTFIKKDSKSFVLTSYDAEKKQINNYYYFPKNAVENPDRLPKIKERKKTNEIILCKDSEPEKYLAKYLTATALGGKFQTDKETQENFKKNFVSELEKSHNEKKFSKVFEIGNKASGLCREELQQRFQERSAERTNEIANQNPVYNKEQSYER